MPMPVYTFLESYDFAGRKVAPFCTHEGSGLGRAERRIRAATRGIMLEGFAIFGHAAQNDRDGARKQVTKWLKSLGF